MSLAAKAPEAGVRSVTIEKHEPDGNVTSSNDIVAVEEPLEIRLACGNDHRAVAITMRTPGNDIELACGFLFTEGVLRSPESVVAVRHCGRFPSQENTIRVELGSFDGIDLERLSRNFYTTSSCGVCGRSSLDALTASGVKPVSFDGTKISGAVVSRLPDKLIETQDIFGETGGLHAAALFDANGEFVDAKEDVGRHNAVDKLIGRKFLDSRLPLSSKVLFLSGRASFELLQKAAAAGIPVVCAVGAPSSLAIEAAIEFGITLVGFVRDGRFNVYSNEHRVIA